MTLRIDVLGMASCGGMPAASRTGGGGAGDDGIAAAAVGWAAAAASISRLTMRPPGPLPVTAARSRFVSRAMAARQGAREDPPARRFRYRRGHRCHRPATIRIGDGITTFGRCRRRLGPGQDGGGRGRVQGGLVLALLEQERDDLIDGHGLATLAHQDAREGALLDRFDLHGCLVGLDLGNDVAALDQVPFPLQPFRQRPLLHRGRERRHEDRNRHERCLGAQR